MRNFMIHELYHTYQTNLPKPLSRDGWNDHDCEILNPGDSRQYPAPCSGVCRSTHRFEHFSWIFLYTSSGIKLNSVPSNIDQGIGNSTGCGHFSKLPVTESTQTLRCKFLESPLCPWQLLSAQYFQMYDLAPISAASCSTIMSWSAILHLSFFTKKNGPACECLDSNQGVQQKRIFDSKWCRAE